MTLISNPLLVTALMLAVSNLFMTFAWSLEEYVELTLVHGGLGELGHCAVRVSVAGTRQSHRLHRAKSWTIKDSPRSHYAVGVCAVCSFVYESTIEDGLSVCRAMHDGRGVFYF